MSGTGFEMKEVLRTEPKRSSVNQAILFIIPSIVVTIISIILFTQLTALTEQQRHIFSITIIAAIVLSLVGMAGMQLLIYRIIDDPDKDKDGAARRGTNIGIVYSIIFSIIITALVSPYFLNVLHFSLKDFFYFAYLLFLYSAIWVVVSAFWASERYKYPAIIFTFSYLAIFAFTYGAYGYNPAYAISGYAFGTTVLLLLFLLASKIMFRKSEPSYKLSKTFTRLTKLIPQNSAAMMFNIFFVLAIFLDKIIVWVYQGVITGQGLLVTGPYTEGAFLGLIPMFSIATTAYFTRRTKSLVDNRYNGTFGEIVKGIEEYKQVYWTSMNAMLVITLGFMVIVASLVFFFIKDPEVLRILLTYSMGCIFFVVIIFNSTVLVIFGKSTISTYAVLAVIILELATIPLVSINVWYCALGFLVGSFIGFLISFLSTIRLFSNYEYNMFGFLLKS